MNIVNKYIPFLLLFFILGVALPAHAKDPVSVISCVVIKVSDGDTVTAVDSLGTKVKVRLYGIDAPEVERVNRKTGKVSKQGQPYGLEAYQALRGKLLDRPVKLEGMAVDRYKRLVSLVWLGNRNINKEMVSEGYAWAYRQYLDRPHASEYIGAEEVARKAKRGLWQQVNPQPPWEFRRQMRVE